MTIPSRHFQMTQYVRWSQTGDEMSSSMLYQSWISSALDLIHHVMNFSILKSFNFSSSVFLERTLVKIANADKFRKGMKKAAHGWTAYKRKSY